MLGFMKIRRHHSLIHQVLQGFQDAKLSMGKGQAALEVDHVGWFDRTIRAKFYGRTGYEGSCGHDHLGIVARHIPGFWGHKAVHRSCCLDSLAESDHALRGTEANGLDDVVSALLSVRHHWETDPFIDIGGKNSPF